MVEASDNNQMVELDTGAGEQIQDEAIFKAGQYEAMTTETARKFSVRNPQDHGGHIVYECKGVDSKGEWEGKRRYNDFYNLRQALTSRWPGLPLPTIPPKKAIGNKDLVFIQERRYYLERFLRKLSKLEYIIEGEEFQIFARPSGSIESALKRLPKLGSKALYEKLKTVTLVDDAMYDLI